MVRPGSRKGKERVFLGEFGNKRENNSLWKPQIHVMEELGIRDILKFIPKGHASVKSRASIDNREKPGFGISTNLDNSMDTLRVVGLYLGFTLASEARDIGSLSVLDDKIYGVRGDEVGGENVTKLKVVDDEIGGDGLGDEGMVEIVKSGDKIIVLMEPSQYDTDNSRKSEYSKTDIVEIIKETPLPPCLPWISKEIYEEDISQFVEQTQESQPLDCHLYFETESEKVNKSEGVVDCVNFEVGLVGPHSKYFSKLCLDDFLFVESFKIVEECEDEEQKFYILDFAPVKQHKNISHLKAEWFTMHIPLLSSLIFIPPPYDRGNKMDAMLGVKFISSRWRKKLIGSCRDSKLGASWEATQAKVNEKFECHKLKLEAWQRMSVGTHGSPLCEDATS
ncbi:hypothetical protein CQW23_02637 [Capsicum baccatum]|uniref:Uncharacterized protein n=1 Tax=Capsicum baccatum TaxID=33114 RepID=A0A2G2XS06_CAPBA|nr:hypothetical protein CQW23_02637 [Capsicum baccatum]